MIGAVRHWAASHPGAVRARNEDAFVCRPELGLFAVADGVGGQRGGEVASARLMALLAEIGADLPAALRLGAVRCQVQAAHRSLLGLGGARAAGAPATTVVVLLLHGDHFALLWAGDSRAYLLRDGDLHRLTADHSLVQELIDARVIDEAQAATHASGNVITRAVGAGPPPLALDKAVGGTAPGDRFLLCSDGLYRALELDEIARILAQEGDAAERLIAAALANRARDNVTAVVAAM